MTGVRPYRARLLALALGVCIVAMQLASAQAPPPRRIAAFGSSVSFGTGDERGLEGYTGMLRGMLEPKGWQVLNQSRGGDTTKLLATRWAPEGAPTPGTRYLLPVNPAYAIIGLSLANEGIFEAQTKDDKDAVFRQFADGIQGFVAKARQQHIVPVVTLCYPRSVYTPVEYGYIRRMNILENSWDVPTVNFLGALDDGNGRWARGFMFNDKHPNTSGHRELALSFVPTLFEALERGKTAPVRVPSGRGFVRVSEASSPLTFASDQAMHSFALSVLVRSRNDGTVAAISGSALAAISENKRVGNGAAAVEFEEITLSPDRPFASLVSVRNGKWNYTSSTGANVTSSEMADGGWHHLVVSHYAARGETLFFVDGTLAGTATERLAPDRFILGGPGSGRGQPAPKESDYKDLFVFRSALNADEVAVLEQGKMIQASLEIYAPLVDESFRPGSKVENRAQSLSELTVGSETLVHVSGN